MTSFTLQGSILELIATHTRASWVIASVNREWSEAVNAARKELRKEFLGSVCNLLCLRPAEFDNALVDTRLEREVLMVRQRSQIRGQFLVVQSAGEFAPCRCGMENVLPSHFPSLPCLVHVQWVRLPHV